MRLINSDLFLKPPYLQLFATYLQLILLWLNFTDHILEAVAPVAVKLKLLWYEISEYVSDNIL